MSTTVLVEPPPSMRVPSPDNDSPASRSSPTPTAVTATQASPNRTEPEVKVEASLNGRPDPTTPTGASPGVSNEDRAMTSAEEPDSSGTAAPAHASLVSASTELLAESELTAALLPARRRQPEDDARALALAKRRLEIQIAYVENARRKISDESHPDFVARRLKIDDEREQLLARAASKEAYWQNCTAVIFAYECDEARSEYLLNCDRLRQEMLEEIHHEMEILNEQRNGSKAARKTTRKTRSTRNTKPGADEKAVSLETTAAQKVKKRYGNVFQPLEKGLAPSEIDHDLRELANGMELVSKKRRMDPTNAGELPYLAKYHRATFLYRDFVFQEGDEVFVRNLMNGSEYVAVICSITSTELFVLSEKGKYNRLVFMDLRLGRVVLSTLTPEQTAALNEREEREGLLSS